MKSIIVVAAVILGGCAQQPVASYCRGDWGCEHLTARGMTAPAGAGNWGASSTIAREYRGSVTPVFIVQKP
jgi:hypothetical protein